jgi:hypothetical protein
MLTNKPITILRKESKASFLSSINNNPWKLNVTSSNKKTHWLHNFSIIIFKFWFQAKDCSFKNNFMKDVSSSEQILTSDYSISNSMRIIRENSRKPSPNSYQMMWDSWSSTGRTKTPVNWNKLLIMESSTVSYKTGTMTSHQHSSDLAWAFDLILYNIVFSTIMSMQKSLLLSL